MAIGWLTSWNDTRDRPRTLRRRSSGTFIGPGDGAEPGAGCGNAVDIAVERDMPFHLLHHLVDVAVEHRHGSEALQIRQRARTVVRAPSHPGFTDESGMCANTTIGVLLFSRFTSFSSHSNCSLPSVPSPPAVRSTTFTRPTKWTPPWSKLCQPAPLVPLPNRCR